MKAFRPLGPALYPWSLPSLPARSPHVSIAMFFAIVSIAFPPFGSISWWYASTELARIANGELWPTGKRWLVAAKGIGVASIVACATFLALAIAARL